MRFHEDTFLKTRYLTLTHPQVRSPDRRSKTRYLTLTHPLVQSPDRRSKKCSNPNPHSCSLSVSSTPSPCDMAAMSWTNSYIFLPLPAGQLEPHVVDTEQNLLSAHAAGDWEGVRVGLMALRNSALGRFGIGLGLGPSQLHMHDQEVPRACAGSTPNSRAQAHASGSV